jgi:lipopolysaccharide/colanic/teichoic acid biosynthesis glycosyltransferase
MASDEQLEGLRDMSATDTGIHVAFEDRASVTWAEVRASIRSGVKRSLDVVLATTLLLLALPVLAVLAVLVKLDGGPALFCQRRVGRRGGLFGMYKLRSMAPCAEERLRANPELYERYVSNGFKLPADEDPRITRLGRFLRASSLDELPQLINVVRGDMSLVGPRPIVAPELVEYQTRGAEAAYLSARPGLTGLWQVSGRSLVGYDERVQMDAQYLREANLRTDLSILVRTVGAVIRRHGAH